MRFRIMVLLIPLLLLAACGRGPASEAGKLKVTSTADLGKVGVGSSPPPVVPK